MSTRNGPHARAHSIDDRPGSSGSGSKNTARYSRAEYAKVLALQEEVARADADYQRLRLAYLDVVEHEPTHEVAIAMIGADMDRAHARLQALIGLPRLPFTHEPSSVMRRDAQRVADEKH
ncbi:hypothetical protein H8N03_15520 [Ramlibacter sp. USB13]|uniref:Uncharacterized protein n=1 Tax=Ramlibacter cellulosilyticus TaxID=2764187 RepID=A0A923SFX0_9BURK|nr:hypothetical protein [Ramlibacter cellulosilyticus]MBC5784362.1 hypothetical protein [Ramlibacter cellulosilyticus]